MTNNEVHERLIVWLGTLLGVTVIKDRQQGDRPARPYAMVDLANWRNLHDNVDDIGFRNGTALNSQGKLEVLGLPVLEVEWVFQLFVYGMQGETLVRRLQSAVHVLQLQESLAPLHIHEVGAANSVPELVGQKWEPRTQVNIVVRGTSSDEFVVDVIEEHDISITGERT